MTAEAIAKALGGRRSGRGWLVQCVVHDDRHPSLALADGGGGKLLCRCYAGCDPADILRELARRGLLPPRERPTPAAAAAWRRERQDLELAEHWRHGAALRLDALRENLAARLREAMAGGADDVELEAIGERLALVEAKLAAIRTSRGAALIDMWREARTADAAKAAAVGAEGREDVEHAEAVTAAVVVALVVAAGADRRAAA